MLLTNKYKAQVDALRRRLQELLSVTSPYDVYVYHFECSEAGGFRISEISIDCQTSGTSFLRCDSSPEILALILAAEDFVRMFNVEPFRPSGWSSDLDERAEADWKLEQVAKKIIGVST